ncbi:MAG: 1-acyl-sn-glycerol-3-phosphate acyltransferase [Anaerolineaceae bacterium]|nr:1-acyl-sn-glycerol-3-phosphate acyltransferase [Anaerolineaceae bacterium]
MTQIVGRALLGLLTRTTVAGRENLPEKGPLILVGNHNALMEAALMVLHSPYQIELLGAGDIPFDPRYAWAIERYGYIPIRRGEMDRLALNKALGVLKQGVIGMFPEGGIWEAAFKRARTGVSWLSSQANAPIIPIGFGGIDGALGATMKLRRPRMLMNIGHVIPPIPAEIEGSPAKKPWKTAHGWSCSRLPRSSRKKTSSAGTGFATNVLNCNWLFGIAAVSRLRCPRNWKSRSRRCLPSTSIVH